jgi:hypothetical protein
MHSVIKFALGLGVGVAVGATGFAAIAQKDPKVGVTVNDPIGPAPDPAAVGETLPRQFLQAALSQQRTLRLCRVRHLVDVIQQCL